MNPGIESGSEPLGVCVISREGTPVMNDMIRGTLRGLADRGFRIGAVHLTAGNDDLLELVQDVSEWCLVERDPTGWNPIERANQVSALLLGGLREMVGKMLDGGARAILYMEGDKVTFPEHVAAVAAPILDGRADITLATRSAAGWKQVPLPQRAVEGVVNRSIGRQAGIATDYLYGPRAFTREAAALFADYPGNDWGVMMYPVVAGVARGMRLESVEVVGAPQPRYMEKYDPLMRPAPAHVIWRSLQCLGILRATRAGVTASRGSS